MGGGRSGRPAGEDELSALGRGRSFLREAARRYGPEGEFWEDHRKIDYLPITHWEIWNEENIVTQAKETRTGSNTRGCFASSGRTPAHREAGVEGADRRALRPAFARIPPNVASGKLPRARLPGGQRQGPISTGVALHPYVAQAKAMGPELNNFRRIMRQKRPTARDGRFYITELGLGLGQRPRPATSGAPRARPTSSRKRSKMLSSRNPDPLEGRRRSGGSPGPTKAAPASSAAPPAC